MTENDDTLTVVTGRAVVIGDNPGKMEWTTTSITLDEIERAVRWIKARYGDITIAEVEKKLSRGD